MNRSSFDDNQPLLPPTYEVAQTTRPTKHPLPPCCPPEIAPSQTRKFNDSWAAFLFGATMVVFGYLATIGLPLSGEVIQGITDKAFVARRGPVPSDPSATQVLHFFTLAFASSIGFSWLYLWLLTKIPRTLIDLSYGIPITLLGLSTLITLSTGGIIASLFPAIFFALSLWAFLVIRPFLALSAVVLATVSKIVQRFTGTIFVSMAGGFVWFLFTCLWSAAGLGLNKWAKEHDIESIIMTFLVFVYFWVTQLTLDIGHATTCGTVATYFFTGVQQPGSDAVVIPSPNVTAQSLYRTVTSAFGTVCFSSLLSALVQTLKLAARQNHRNVSNSDDQNILAILFSACLVTIVSIFGDILDMFNKYTLTEVAIYGKPYCQAGKDTWNLAKTRGIDVIINDCAVSKVVGMGGFMCVLFTGLAGMASAYFLLPATEGQYWIVIGAIVFILTGITVFMFVGRVVDSATAAMYVCLVEDPATIQKLQPDLFAVIEDVYPEITWGLQSIAYQV
ncbi:UNVERIFIED_CONTAM: putative choline transporter, neither null mutation nor overexpression affects choline transport [Siphonaria sp. JEL0065]|nr:putative choline transporter, neither null mutation nor overexpression affects choline transport [Siphonaria sp. JEL0065]